LVFGSGRSFAGGVSIIRKSFADSGHVFADPDGLDGSEKSIASTRQGLNKARVVSGVVESLTKSFHCRIEAMFKVHEGVSRPEFLTQLFARNQLAWLFEKAGEDLDWLPLQPDFAALLRQLPGTQVKLEKPESQCTRSWHRWSHGVSTECPESNTDR
jgi:hypothetical protein